MYEEEESTAVAADVSGDLPEDEHSLPPEHNLRPGEFAPARPADGLLYRQRRHM
jgi:hypothetical protein